MARRASGWISLGAAAILHALVIAAASGLHEPRGYVLRSAASSPEIEIEVAGSIDPGASAGAGAIESVASFVPRAGERGRAPANVMSGADSDSEAAAPMASAPEPAERSAIARAKGAQRPSLAQMGIGAPVPFLLIAPKRAASRREALARRTDQVLSAGLAQGDFERGLGPHGAVVSALRTATGSGRAPARGSALFVARIERERVTLRVVEANGDRAAWNEAAARAMQALRGRKSRLPAGARAIEVTIRITSNVELPSGADPGLELRALGIPLQQGEGKRSARLELLSPHVELGTVAIPDPAGGDPIELPSLELGLDVFGYFGDPADIGATARRVVHAKVEQQTVVRDEPE